MYYDAYFSIYQKESMFDTALRFQDSWVWPLYLTVQPYPQNC